MKWWKYVASAVILLIMLTGVPNQARNVGKITNVRDLPDAEVPTKEASVSYQGQEVKAVYYETGAAAYEEGDLVVLDTAGGLTTINDYYRTPALTNLFGLFLIAVLLITDVGGLRSLAGLSASFLVIMKFVLPQIAAGSHPITVVLTASLIILFISYYLTHGFNTKTTIALAGTFFSLIVTAILTTIFSGLAKLTGFGAEETSFLATQLGHEINVYNLLLAGIIIGTLGVLDDITISQASVVAELKQANSRLSMIELFRRGMRVGHDHIASLVNTLVLVYTGTALPLLLLFTGSNQNWTSLVNYEPVAEEIVRTLTGSIGLVAAVPITTLLAAYWYSGKK